MSPRPTWTMLAIALRSPSVGNERLSEELKRKFSLSVNFEQQEQVTQQKSEPANDAATLTLPTVFKVVFPLAAEWKNIGLFLGISDSTLDMIACDNAKVNDCLREMLSVWLKRVSPQPTWETLADEVESFDERIADKIRKTYCTS